MSLVVTLTGLVHRGLAAQPPEPIAVRHAIPGIDSIIVVNDSVRVWGAHVFPRRVPGVNGDPSPLAGHCIDGDTGELRAAPRRDPHGLTVGVGETFRLGGAMRAVWHDYELLRPTAEGPVFRHFRRVFDRWSLEIIVLRPDRSADEMNVEESPLPRLRDDPLPEAMAARAIQSCEGINKER